MGKASSYHYGNLREELLKASFELLDQGGIETVGIRQVARVVGVAHSAPANHFKNKKALFTAMATEVFTHLIEVIQTKLQRDAEDLRDSIQLFSETILNFGLKYPNRYLLIWRRDCVDNEDPALHEALENIYQQLTAILQKYAKNQKVDVESQAIALWSLIHGYVSLRIDSNLEAGRDLVTGIERQRAIIDVIVDGLLN